MEIINPFSVSDISYYYNFVHRKDFVPDAHRHRGFELVVITEGSLSLTCDNNIYILKKNDCYIIPSYCFHYNIMLTDPVKMTVVHFKAPDSFLKKNVITYHLNDKTSILYNLFNEEFTKLNEHAYGQNPIVTDSAKKLFEIFLHYSTVFEQKNTSYEVSDNKATIYKNAVDFMTNNINKKLSVEEIAKECLVCKTTLKNIFSYYTGKGCIDFFNDLKLSKAKKLLADGKSCAEVTDFLGFSSQSYFSKKFKKEFGYTPSQRKE